MGIWVVQVSIVDLYRVNNTSTVYNMINRDYKLEFYFLECHVDADCTDPSRPVCDNKSCRMGKIKDF